MHLVDEEQDFHAGEYCSIAQTRHLINCLSQTREREYTLSIGRPTWAFTSLFPPTSVVLVQYRALLGVL